MLEMLFHINTFRLLSTESRKNAALGNKVDQQLQRVLTYKQLCLVWGEALEGGISSVQSDGVVRVILRF